MENETLMKKGLEAMGVTEDRIFELGAIGVDFEEDVVVRWKRYWKKYGILHPNVIRLLKHALQERSDE